MANLPQLTLINFNKSGYKRVIGTYLQFSVLPLLWFLVVFPHPLVLVLEEFLPLFLVSFLIIFSFAVIFPAFRIMRRPQPLMQKTTKYFIFRPRTLLPRLTLTYFNVKI